MTKTKLATTDSNKKRKFKTSVSKIRRDCRSRRHNRLRKKVFGTTHVPRLAVHRSSRHIHVQLIDDLKGITLTSASSIENSIRTLNGDKKNHSVWVGELIAQRAKIIGVEKIVFDRGGYTYSGRIAALANAMRDGGLKF